MHLFHLKSILCAQCHHICICVSSNSAVSIEIAVLNIRGYRVCFDRMHDTILSRLNLNVWFVRKIYRLGRTAQYMMSFTQWHDNIRRENERRAQGDEPLWHEIKYSRTANHFRISDYQKPLICLVCWFVDRIVQDFFVYWGRFTRHHQIISILLWKFSADIPLWK